MEGGRWLERPRVATGLGGSSAINGMAYIRGHALDYQRWAEEGAAGWSYAEVLPYFRRSECHSPGEDPWRGGSGPLATVCFGIENPLSRAFVEAGAAAGSPVTQDVNGYQQEGFGPFDRNIGRSERASTAHAFIDPARSRPNLCIRTDTVVTKVLLEGRRASGGVRSSDGSAETLRAEREVILAAGAFHSPQLLMLSGVGPADHLRDHGIVVPHELPGVGANLQDHLEVHMQWRADRRHARRNRYAGPLARFVAGAQRFLTPRGVPARCSVPPPSAEPPLSDVTVSPGWRRAPRRASCSSTSTIARSVRRGTAAHVRVRGGGTGGSRLLRQRTPGGRAREAPASRPGASRGYTRRVPGADARARTVARYPPARRGRYRAAFASHWIHTQFEPGRTRFEPARFLAVSADVSQKRRSSRARVPMTSSRCTQAIEARDGPLA